jgi:cation transport ATPase
MASPNSITDDGVPPPAPAPAPAMEQPTRNDGESTYRDSPSTDTNSLPSAPKQQQQRKKRKQQEQQQPYTIQNQQIKKSSTAVLVIPVVALFVQIVWLILYFSLRYQWWYETDKAAFWTNFSLSMCISLALLFFGYIGVRSNNPTACYSGLGYLDLYRGICIVGTVTSLCFSIWFAIAIASFLTFIINAVLVVLYVIGESRASALVDLLSVLHQNFAEEDMKRNRTTSVTTIAARLGVQVV